MFRSFFVCRSVWSSDIRRARYIGSARSSGMGWHLGRRRDRGTQCLGRPAILSLRRRLRGLW